MKIYHKDLNLIFRKLKISDFKEFKELFYLCFNKRISFNFFKWRYFDDKFSFCYGVFHSSKMIANVGMKSMKLSNKKNERIFSRHSSMVLKQYRGLGIFSELLKEVKKKIQKDIRIIVMWPNKINFASFGIGQDKFIKKKYYLYKTNHHKIKIKKTLNYNIELLNKFKSFIQNNDNFFLKDLNYFKNRYLSYKKNDISKIKVITLTVNGIKKLKEAEVIWKKTQQKFLNAFGLNNKKEFDLFMNKISKLNF